MPRKKKSVLPKEELKFVESPKAIYHDSNIPFVYLAANPVVLQAVSAVGLSEKWVTTSFKNLKCPTTLSKSRKRQPKKKESSNIVTHPQDLNTTPLEKDEPVPRKLHGYKPLIFQGLNDFDDFSDVEDVRVDDNGCLEDEATSAKLMTVKQCIKNLCPKFDECKSVVRSPKKRNFLECKSADFISNISTNYEAREEMTFASYIAEVNTPEMSMCQDSPEAIKNLDIRSGDERNTNKHDSVNTDNDDDEECAVEPTQHHADESTTPTYSPLRSHGCKSSHRHGSPEFSTMTPPRTPSSLELGVTLSPSPTLTRSSQSFLINPLPVLISLSHATDGSSNSAKWFRSQFFDRVEFSKEDPQSIDESLPTLRVCDRNHQYVNVSKKLNPLGLNDLETPLNSKSSAFHRQDNSEELESLADDTPESEQGMTFRLKQVKDKKRIFLHINKTNKIPIK